MNKSLKASFTVEASMVIALFLIYLFTFFSTAMRLHDICYGNAVAAEILERASHTEDAALEELGIYGNEKLSSMLSQKDMNLVISKEKNSITAGLKGKEYSNIQKVRRYEPWSMARKLTLIDIIK